MSAFLLALALQAGPAPDLAPERAVSDQVVVDVDGDGADELCLVLGDGGVALFGAGEGDQRLAPRGPELRLPHPDQSALALVDVLGTGRRQLLVLDPSGVRAQPFALAGEDRPPPAVALTPASRPDARLGRPMMVDFAVDVNADGKLDLTLPVSGGCELWLRSGTSPEGLPLFELSQSLPIRILHWRESDDRHLALQLSNHVVVSALDTIDLNGDGRPDLRTREGTLRRFYLQGADGRFSRDPIEVDLAIFRDTTPRAELRAGETLVLSDRARLQSGDLDGDGIPDHVIAHRRKIWSFLSSPAGPQFTHASTRIVAEDVSGLLLVHLDDDARKDLLVFKLDLPTTSELVLGIVRSIDVRVRARGYPTRADGTFDNRARWKRDLILRVPSLMRLLRESDDLVDRFLEVMAKFRWSARGDFDGDGTADLALVDEDETAVELWLRPGTGAGARADERWLRELLFENPDPVFDVERVLKLAAQVFDTRTSALTGARAADARQALPQDEGYYTVDLLAGDFDGDGSDALLLVRESESEPGRRIYRVVPLAP